MGPPYTLAVVVICWILNHINAENLTDTSGIGIVVSLFGPGHLSLIARNPNNVNMTSMKSGKSVLPIQTYYFNTPRAKIVSMASDPRKNALFILDSDSHSIYRMENFNIWVNDTMSIVPIQKGVSKTSAQIAYDWYSEIVYWVDGYYNWVGMQPAFTTDNSLYKIIIHKGLNRPEGIAVDPINGYLFYSDMGKPQRIERSSLIGQERTSIITSGVDRVYDITVDQKERRLYWVDAGRHTLESSDYNGRNRRLLTRMNSVKFTSVVIFGEFVYVASFTSNTVTKLNKRTGNINLIVVVDDGTPVGAEIWDPTSDLPVSKECPDFGCSHICVHMPSGPKCVCKEGYTLATDNKACVDENLQKGLLLANATHICNMDIRHITALKEDMFCHAANLSGIKYMAVDIANQWLFYVDSELNVVMQYSMIFNISTTIYEATPNVTGLTYDWLDENLVWSTSNSLQKGAIHVFSLTKWAHTELYSDLENPSYVKVNPLNRELYWIEGRGNNYTIKTGSIDGSSEKVIVNSDSLKKPTGLFYQIEKNRLFWINWDSIHSCKTDGSDLTSHLNSISVLFFGVELLVYKDHALWTHGKSFMMTGSIFRKSAEVKIDTSHYGTLTGMAIYDPDLQRYERGPCEIMNGGCEQVCLPSASEVTCKCDFGFRLNKDLRNCSSDTLKDEFLIIADHTHGRLYQAALSDGGITALDFPAVTKPACVLYNRKTKLIYWVEIESRGSQIKQATLKGENTTVLMEAGDIYPDRIAMDYTTGHIYFTAVANDIYESYVGVLHPHRTVHKKLISQLGTPRAIAVHPSAGYMFWTDHNKNSPHIGRAFMDGSSQRVLLSKDVVWPNGLVIDFKENRLYWADGHTDKIESVDIHGLNRKEVLKVLNQQLVDIDLFGSYLYYTAWNTQKVSKVLLHSNGTGSLVDWMPDVPELGRLDSIEIDPGNSQPKSFACLVNNGDCSTFCLPTPNGHTCACEENVNLLADGKTCEVSGGSPCPERLPHGFWSSSCHRLPTENCTYYCKGNYLPNKAYPSVPCGREGEWSIPPEFLCQAKRCVIFHPIHHLLNDCQPTIGNECEYACNNGYQKNPDIQKIKCLSTQKWNYNSFEVCRQFDVHVDTIETTPSIVQCRNEDLPNVELNRDCSRLPDKICSFTCKEGFSKKDEDITDLVCLPNGKWNMNNIPLCTDTSGIKSFRLSQEKKKSNTPFTTIAAALAAVFGVVLIAALVVFFFYRRRKRSVVGRYESQQNDTNVYCEPQKGIVNLSADTGSSTENNHYAQMSDI
ncbi:low-density lipoprotein receptor-related protein 2-like [Ostrea edulis]|uniref:low-density lipoprotein receptor-related protein 2-like n=1 Tax=Ostrea edulis TaxID=37623 RepID=UPI0024AEBDCF|nr:low-density lipoprotein receptor-related protein 2-like [Ostrea edulis]